MALAAVGLPATENPAGDVAQVDSALLLEVESQLDAFADGLSQNEHLMHFGKEAIYSLLKVYLQEKPRIYGAALAFAVVKKDGIEIKSSPYVYRSSDKFIKTDLIDNYDYTLQDWYAVPVKEDRPVWSEPYYDEGGGEAWMKTYSIPIYSENKKTMLIGVVTSDVLISKP